MVVFYNYEAFRKCDVSYDSVKYCTGKLSKKYNIKKGSYNIKKVDENESGEF